MTERHPKSKSNFLPKGSSPKPHKSKSGSFSDKEFKPKYNPRSSSPRSSSHISGKPTSGSKTRSYGSDRPSYDRPSSDSSSRSSNRPESNSTSRSNYRYSGDAPRRTSTKPGSDFSPRANYRSSENTSRRPSGRKPSASTTESFFDESELPRKSHVKSQIKSQADRPVTPPPSGKRPNDRASPRHPSHSYPTKSFDSSEGTTSWEPIEKWYKGSVGEEGHYYHQNLVIPSVLKLLALSSSDTSATLLDLACGPGVLARHIPKEIHYSGIDISPSLVKSAELADKNPLHTYHVGDATKPLSIQKKDFTHAAIILAIQNMEHPEKAIQNAASHLIKGGKLVMAMNHPCFRIPRQSSWGVDQTQKSQYRRIDRYLSTMSIPIQAHPSKGEQSPTTWSFHNPISLFSKWLFEAGFCIELIEELASDKASVGGAAKMENRSRAEIPLFLMISARKI